MAVERAGKEQGLGVEFLRFSRPGRLAAGAQSVVLNAREEAARFYRPTWIREIGSAGLLFGSIPHLRMRKAVAPN